MVILEQFLFWPGSDSIIEISTLFLVWKHVHHYFWDLLQDCHPALGDVIPQCWIWPQNWNQHYLFSMEACASLISRICSRIAIQHWEMLSPYGSMCITIFEACTRIVIQHLEMWSPNAGSDPRIGISPISLAWKHVNHYFKVASGDGGFASSAGIVLLIVQEGFW